MGIQATDPFFQSVQAAAAGQAAPTLATLYRVHVGPGEFALNYPGDDLLLFLNPTANSLVNPELGIDPAGVDTTFLTPLRSGGFATDPEFGGTGPTVLSSLGPFGVYGTLIPDGGTIFNFAADGFSAKGVHLDHPGDFAFIQKVPEPSSFALFAIGLAGLAFRARRNLPRRAKDSVRLDRNIRRQER